MADSAPHSHCPHCGHPFADTTDWPRRCGACGRTHYRNPLPVAVALLPVREKSGTALAVIRRGIAPARGELALPGGFMETGETWQQAVTRELAEETGITADPADVRLADVLSDTDGHLLVFGLLPTLDAAALPPFTPNDEATDLTLLRAPAPLGFPLHTRAAAAWFADRRGAEPPA